jgi:hypothetical protein
MKIKLDEIEEIIKKSIYNSNQAKSKIIACKMTFADNYYDIGFWDAVSNAPLPLIEIDFFEGRKIQQVYETNLNSDERFNRIEICFDESMNPIMNFIWDQAFYDADVENNKKLKKKK